VVKVASKSTLRKLAGIVASVAALTLAFSGYVALVYYGTLDLGADWIVELEFGQWIAFFVLVLSVLLALLIILLVIRPRDDVAPTAASDGQFVDITCAHCGKEYKVEDDGTRPLYHACPHCGNEASIEPEEGTMTALSEEDLVPGMVRETSEGKKELILRCSNCRHVFPVDYTEDRPLYSTCPNCSKKGVLN
jgi:DNA-directed RNA polymerase subunit RPC12/RpoP/uncharacterized membrane protein